MTTRTLLFAALLLGSSATAQAGVCEAHFEFEGNFQDSSGNGYHGLNVDANNRPIGGGGYEPGRFGQAMRMNGALSVVAPLDLYWESCPKVTVAVWVRLAAEPASFIQLVSTGYGAGPKIGIGRNRIDISGGEGLRRVQYNIEPGVWTPLVGTWDYETREIALHWPEGILTEPLGVYAHPPQPDFWIGGDGYLSNVNSIAEAGVLIDDVRVWGRILSPEEIAALQAGNPPEVARCGTGAGAPAEPPDDLPLPSPGPTEPNDEAPTPLPDPRIVLPDPELTLPDDLPEPPPSEYDPGSTTERRPDPRIALPDPGLTVPDDLPEPPPSELDPEPYLEKLREENEQNFGPRDRAQVVIGYGFKLGYASVPDAFASADGRIDILDLKLKSLLANGNKIREMFRVKGTNAIVAVADDGTVTIEGNAQGRAVPVVNKIAEIRGNGRPIDLVADRSGDYVVLSGTNVYSHQAPQGAVTWAQQELAAGLQVTALALLSGDAWIGVSRRGVASGGMPANYWGRELLDDVQRFVNAGEVVQDISASPSSQNERWAIATDKRVFVRGFDCRDYTTFGVEVESNLSRQWDCEVWQRHCLANRAAWDENDMGSDPDPGVWQVNLLVTAGIENYENEAKEDFDCWLEKQLGRTELLFNDTPRLELRVRTQHRTRVDGVDLPQFVMDSGGKYARFMDRNFDIMAKSKTEGYYPVLVVDDICIGKEKGAPDCEIGGMATFPHVVDPLTRKHGIIMLYNDPRDWVLAHELGHYLSLIHTFQGQGSPGAIACNNVYSFDSSNNQCNSCRGTINATQASCSAEYNVMDYCDGDNDDVRINACQRERAARQRERYQTDDGHTNYFKMKGHLGEPYCDNDSDCLDDEYCNTGVGTIGRNVCKSRLSDGSTCSRSGQCASGKCSLFKCK